MTEDVGLVMSETPKRQFECFDHFHQELDTFLNK